MRHSLWRYRAVYAVAVPLALLAIFWTWHGRQNTSFLTPNLWRLSYPDSYGLAVTRTVPAPIGTGFVEIAPQGPLTVEMLLAACLPYKRYRFWVGPYGKDSTARQPQAWTLQVEGKSGAWVEAGAERFSGYENNHWYAFPLKYDLPCIDRIRMKISKAGAGNLLRLYSVEFTLH